MEKNNFGLELRVKVKKITEEEVNEAINPEIDKMTPLKKVQKNMPKTKSKRKKLSVDFPCELCGKILKGQKELLYHQMAVHEKIKPHICQTCGKGFVRKGKLTEHFDIIHLKKHKYKCIPCNKEYTQSTALKYHKLNNCKFT